MVTMMVAFNRRAASIPVMVAAPGPLFSRCRTTVAPALRASSPVASKEPSSTTITRSTNRFTACTTAATRPASLYAGIMATIIGLRKQHEGNARVGIVHENLQFQIGSVQEVDERL